MKNRRLVHISSAVMLILSGLLVISCVMGGCPTFGSSAADATTQAALDKNAAQIADLQAKVEASRVASSAAYETAIKANDLVAAQTAQAQLDSAKRDADTLEKAKVVNNAAQAALKAKQGDMSGAGSFLTTFSGALPPPWNIIAILGGGLLSGGILGNWRGTSTTTASAKKTIAAITASDNLIAAGASPMEIILHDASLGAGLASDAKAKALWDATPDSVALKPATIAGSTMRTG